ncbi:MAG: type II toxin-antitoxin system RelE/ParE family toxin [Devosia sp.]
MTGPQSEDIREIIFISEDARENLASLSDDLRTAITGLFEAAQNNKRLPSKRQRDLSNDMAGISELRQDYVGDTYRAYYVAKFREVIFVLDVDIKKSPSGGEMPKPTRDMLKKRFRAAIANYEAHKPDYEKAYAEREARRKARLERRDTRPGNQRRPK